MKKFCLSFILLLFFSCEKIVEIEIESQKSKLIVNCFFTVEEKFKIRVSKNINILDTIDDIVSNAIVHLFDNENLIDTLIYDDSGFYYSNVNAQKNKEYKILVSHNDFSVIKATNIIPSVVKVEKIERYDSVGYDQEGSVYSQLNVTFTDIPKQNNFYEVSLLTFSDSLSTRLRLFSSDPILVEEGDIEYYAEILPFNDLLFDGQKYTLVLNYYPFGAGNDDLILHFRSVSKEYYLYKKRIIKHLHNRYIDIWEGAGEPIQMYSNIENGYGIFAGYVSDIDTIY